MKSVDLLLQEHRLIERALRVLEDCAALMERGGDVPPPVLASILGFLRSYADAGHHGKEEDIFFPALAAHGVTRHASAIGALEAQHETGRELVRRMDQGLRQITAGGAAAFRVFTQAAYEYIDLLREHIVMEDRVFAGYAEDYLSAAEDAELRARMEEQDLRRPAAERPDRLERMVAELEEAMTRC
jgi:hemerythrin-like domain-containing protein